MPKGNVKEYNSNRGFGVIIDSERGELLSVYANYISLKKGETLNEGQAVEYDIEKNPRNNCAVNVRIIEEILPIKP